MNKMWEYKQDLEHRQTIAEKLLGERLKALFREQQRKYRFDLVMPQAIIGWYIVDFLLPHRMIVIELDGGQHSKIENKTDDIIRDSYLKDNGLYVLRYSNREVIEDTDRVVKEIDTCLCLENPLKSFFRIKRILKRQRRLKEIGKLARPSKYYDKLRI